jgi:thiamine biosynthesis lipoprotein
MKHKLSRRQLLERSGKIAVALPTLSLIACNIESADTGLVTITGATMGTTYTLSISDSLKGTDKAKLQADIDSIFEAVNEKMSTYRHDSELSRFNSVPSTDWNPISLDTIDVVEEALRTSHMTYGAFDATVGPIVNYWGFGPADRKVFQQPHDAFDRIPPRVDFSHIEARRSPPALRKSRADIYVDLCGIAKGFALDKAAEYLWSRNIDNFLLEIGGELRAHGHNPEGNPWRVAIEKPIVREFAIHRIIGLEDAAVATSGHYRNFFELDGVRYSHIIDPRTGKPVTHNLASVSVIDPSTMRADALATALMVLGPELGPQLAQRERLAVLFIIKTGDKFEETITPAFQNYLSV